MLSIRTFLRVAAVIFFLVAVLHLILGLNVDILLGAKVPAKVVQDPVLDSQNRFYGASFTLYGVLLILCASNLDKYATVLRWTLLCFFAGGIARLVSIGAYGLPSPLVVTLLLSEILAPPLVLWWLEHARNAKKPHSPETA